MAKRDGLEVIMRHALDDVIQEMIHETIGRSITGSGTRDMVFGPFLREKAEALYEADPDIRAALKARMLAWIQAR